MKLRRYPAYKPSGNDWLGDIPNHWDVRRLKSVCRFAYGDTLTAEMRNDGDVPVYGSNGQVGLHTKANTKARCIVIGRKGSFGKVNYVEQPAFAIDTTYFVDERYSQNDMRWLFYLLGWLRLDDVTKDSAIPGLGREDAYQRLVPVPPLDEQTAIVRYLDHADECIQCAIGAKERLVKLLTEQRQSIIHRAVTRGLDPNVLLKDSGVEWLGDIPANWEVLPIKRAFVSMDYGISESESDSGTIRLLTMGHLNQGRVTVPSTGGVDEVDKSLLLEKGDLLFNRTNSQELVGKVGLFAGHPTPVTFASYLVRLQPNSRNISEYLNALLNDVTILSHIRREAIPSLHQSNLNPTRYGRIKVPLPPLNEQASILEHLDKATADIDAAIVNAQRRIDLLREYRTRLIADVVTGRVDVRETLKVSPSSEAIAF